MSWMHRVVLASILINLPLVPAKQKSATSAKSRTTHSSEIATKKSRAQNTARAIAQKEAAAKLQAEELAQKEALAAQQAQAAAQTGARETIQQQLKELTEKFENAKKAAQEAEEKYAQEKKKYEGLAEKYATLEKLTQPPSSPIEQIIEETVKPGPLTIPQTPETLITKAEEETFPAQTPEKAVPEIEANWKSIREKLEKIDAELDKQIEQASKASSTAEKESTLETLLARALESKKLYDELNKIYQQAIKYEQEIDVNSYYATIKEAYERGSAIDDKIESLKSRWNEDLKNVTSEHATKITQQLQESWDNTMRTFDDAIAILKGTLDRLEKNVPENLEEKQKQFNILFDDTTKASSLYNALVDLSDDIPDLPANQILKIVALKPLLNRVNALKMAWQVSWPKSPETTEPQEKTPQETQKTSPANKPAIPPKPKKTHTSANAPLLQEIRKGTQLKPVSKEQTIKREEAPTVLTQIREGKKLKPVQKSALPPQKEEPTVLSQIREGKKLKPVSERVLAPIKENVTATQETSPSNETAQSIEAEATAQQ